MKTLVLGAKGNLGMQLVEVFRAAGHEVTAYDREDLDVLDFDAVTRLVRDGGFETVISTVAWNDVDGAELSDKQPTCWKMNAELPGIIAAAAKEAGATFVTYSTDYVFGGDWHLQYSEDWPTCPENEYGRSKEAGERAALAVGGKTYVVRTSRLFGPVASSAASKPGFVDIIIKAARTKPELTVIDEEWGCPTYTVDLAEATLRLVSGDYEPGIYHLVNSGKEVTWYLFTKDIFALLGIETPVQKVGHETLKRFASRPLYAALLNTKFPPLPDRQDALRRYLLKP
jgi:dTDP-4-dehydrorhamnose reductase